MKKKHLYFLWSAIIFVLVFTDVMGKEFLEMSKGYVTGICLIISFIIGNNHYFARNNNQILILSALLSFVVLMALQLFLLGTDASYVEQVRILSLMVIMYLYSRVGYLDEMDALSLLIKVIVIIGSLSVLSITGFDNTVYYRRDALIDKGMLTMWYAMFFCISVVEIANKKQVVLNSVLFVAVFCLNLFVVQSKTAIFAFAVFLLCQFLLSRRKVRRRIIMRVIGVLFILGIIIYAFPEELLPDSVKIGVNYVFNVDFFSVDSTSHDYSTFESRSEIDAFTFSLFLKHPIIGIGCGAYKDIAFGGVGECENSYMDMLVEGGIMYGGPIILIMLYIFYMSILNIRKGISENTNYMCLAIIVSMLVSFRYNDFVRPMSFMFLGCCYFLVNKSKSIGATLGQLK